jgi:Glycosyltransferases involved in cell wall biogenesis
VTTRSATAGTAAAAPLISVLIPCWNAERTLERALDSVLEERALPIECIVVDDASTDGTADVALAIARRDERVVVVRLPENAGVSNARNRGLEQIRGAWLTMLDADDRFVPGGFGTLARAALASDARVVIGQQVWWDGRRTWRTALYDIPDIRLAGRKSLAGSPGLLYSVSPHAKLFHRSCFEGLQFTGRVLGDQPWIIRALLRAGDQIDVLADTVYEWYRPPAGSDSDSITSATRSSIQGGVEAAGVAAGAFAAVAEEAGRLLDETQSAVVLSRYAERLLRSDLGRHLSTALARRDPAIGQLLHAICDFLLAVPPRYLAGSDALTRDILEPPLRNWRNLDPEGWDAFRELADIAICLDPRAIRRRPGFARFGLLVGLRARNAPAHVLAASLLTVQRLLDGSRRRIVRRLGR